MSITIIEDEEKYKNTMIYFKYLVYRFNVSATKTIFTPQNGRDKEGTRENFYSHVLIHYMHPIIMQTFNKYKLGLGIFSMQGIERRNKESKNCAKRFCNFRSNLCISTMGRLFDVFFFGNFGD